MAEKETTQWIDQLSVKAHASDKSRNVALFLSFFLGFLGADRFYLGYGVYGLLKFFTFGGLAIWWVIDFLLLALGVTRDADGGVLYSNPFR